MKTHKIDIRLFNNAGMNFPKCYANAKMLDLEKSRLNLSHDLNFVTCKKCIKSKRY